MKKSTPSKNGIIDGKLPNGRFAPGHKLGKGRPVGSRNKVSLLVDETLAARSDELIQKVIEMALDGDSTAMKLCLERICPPRKDRAVAIDLPKIKKIDDTLSAMSTIASAAAEGELTPSEALHLSGVVEVYRKSVETTELNCRLKDIENQMKQAGI